MKRLSETGFCVIAIMHNGEQRFMRPLRQTREDARRWIIHTGNHERLKLGVAKFRVARRYGSPS